MTVFVVSFLPDCFLSFNEIYPPGLKGKSSFGFLRVRCLVTTSHVVFVIGGERRMQLEKTAPTRARSCVWDRKAVCLLSVHWCPGKAQGTGCDRVPSFHVGKPRSGTSAQAIKEAELLYLSYVQFMI